MIERRSLRVDFDPCVRLMYDDCACIPLAGTEMPTIKDVAREAGVSIATVSYVLNNKPSAISEDTRQLVWEAVHKIGYMPNVTARNLRSNKSRLFGYAWHLSPHIHISQVLDYFTTIHVTPAAEPDQTDARPFHLSPRPSRRSCRIPYSHVHVSTQRSVTCVRRVDPYRTSGCFRRRQHNPR